MYSFYASPTTLTDALQLKAEHGAAARFIAGGTDLLIELTRGVSADSLAVGLIDLTRIPGLAQIWEEDGFLHLGPLVTHNQCVRSRLIVVALLPNDSRKANGNSRASKGCSASWDTASSISTAFT